MTPQEYTNSRYYVIARNAIKVLFKPRSDDSLPGHPVWVYQCVYECSPAMWDAGTPWAKED